MKKFLILITFVMVSCFLAACSEISNSSEPVQIVTSVVTEEVGSVLKGPTLLLEEDPEPAELTEEEKEQRVPTNITISALEIDAPIEPVGLDNEGRVDTIPNAVTVGWYKYGPAPGARGNAILDGHRDWGGKLGSLSSIENLKLGDTVTIDYADGSEQIFNVVSNNTYPINEVPESVMELKGEARVTMITCSGKYVKGYQARVVVVLK